LATVRELTLFLLVFSLWQAYDVALAYFSPPALLITIFSYFAIYAACLLMLALFIKLGRSTFEEHGFKQPPRLGRDTLFSICLTVIYVIVVLMPGFLFGFASRPSQSLLSIILNIPRAVLIAITTESVFRGYIFKDLARNHGFFISLYASSIMFGLHTYEFPISFVELLTMETKDIIIEIVFQRISVVFAAGMFLGFMFYKMDWSLLGPITFRIGTLLFFYFTPLVANSPWWTGLAFEVMAYVSLIAIVDSVIKEPRMRRRRYGLEG